MNIIMVISVIAIVIVIVFVIVGDHLCHPLNGLKVSRPHVLASVHPESTHSNVYLIIMIMIIMMVIIMKSWR